MKRIQILVPMSGQGSRFQKEGYKDPKPLIPVSGTPIIQRLLKNFPTAHDYWFVMADNHKDTGLPEFLRKLLPHCHIDFIEAHQKGPGLAIQQVISQLDPTAPVLVSYCDYGMVWDWARFEAFVQQSQCDACLVSYRGFHAHYLGPMNYAYSRLKGEKVVEIREKNPFTQNRENEYASTGGYYFRTAELLKKALEHQMSKEMHMNGEYYTSLTVQALLDINPESHVRVFEIPGFFQWGTPDDLKIFEYWEKTFAAWNRLQAEPEVHESLTQVMLPMAGVGSRFKDLSKIPKPFLNIGGKPMFTLALHSLPVGTEKPVIVCLKEFESLVMQTMPKSQVIALPKTPAGQALSVAEGVRLLKDHDVLITACDHEVIVSKKVWKDFIIDPQCEAAIFTIKGFPGTLRKPQAFSYVKSDEQGAFPQVLDIGVKKPFTSSPLTESLLVGTFWFKSKEILQQGLEALKKSENLVNGELYLDGIFKHLISKGLKVREVSLDGYINWGDPESLREGLYWNEIFGGRAMAPRARYPGVEF